MNCPKCGKEMTSGFLQTDNHTLISWVSRLIPFGMGFWKSDAKTVSQELSLGIHALPACICKNCMVIVGSYDEKK